MKNKRFVPVITVLILVAMLTTVVGISAVSAQSVCSPATPISVPFSKDGAGTFCYQASSLCDYINSWNMNNLSINGTSYTNIWVSGSSIPPLNGVYTITYDGPFAWSHFEIGGTCGGSNPTNTPVPPTNTPVGPTATRTNTPVGPTNTPQPTNTPGQGGSTTYQAESALVGGGTTIDTNHTGYNGTGFVNFPASGGYVEFQNVNGGSGGSQTLQFRNALGATSARTGQLIVNGSTQNITFNPTASWDTWVTLNVVVTLNGGTGNTIRLQTNGQDLANIDQMTVVSGGSNPTATPPAPTPTQGSGGTFGQFGYSTQNGGTTGGAGGPTVNASTGTEIHQALCGRAANDSPIIIRVSGIITVGNTAKVSGSCNTADGVIEIKDVSNVTILGVGTSAIFDQIGIHVRNSHNIIIQNVNVKNVKKSGSPISNGGDAIGMESNVSNVWVDHCTLEASGGEAEGYDALFDLKNNTQYITLSWSILRNSGRGGLVNSSDTDNTSGFITYHHNYYSNIDSRTPLLRFGTAHSFNNYFNGLNESGMNPRIGGRIKAQNNYFENATNPIGTFYTNDMGYWDVSGNIFGSNVTWSAEGDNSHPAGPNVVSTTSISIPYAYNLDSASSVPSIVLNGAGVGKIGN